ncbi:MAG TPA: universal stress protein [Perlabentimonas sp.]|nr:universal stress protein [Perlabentimonas sp.]
MNEPKKVVLVPWDFTEGSEIALKHAIQLAEVSDNDILLLHIIPNTWFMRIIGKKTTSPQEIDVLKKRLEKIAEDISNEIKVHVFAMVLEGNPTNLIRELVTTANLNLITAYKTYTYGKKKLESGYFMRRLSVKNLNIPFLIAEEAPVHDHYIEIVVPMDYDKRYKETLHWIIYLSKYYKCNINLIKPYISDEGKKRNMANNLYFTKKMLDGNKIVYGIKTAKRKNVFSDEVKKFAANIEADLILIMADKYNTYTKADINSEYSKIPIMWITPRLRKLSGFN